MSTNLKLLNTRDRFGLVSRFFHWTLAVLIFGMVALGVYMVGLTYYDPWYNRSEVIHKAVGIVGATLVLAKLVWSWFSPLPDHEPGLRPWERMAAGVVQRILVGLMIVMPVSGYIVSTSAGAPVDLFGLAQVPALLPKWVWLRDAAIQVHFVSVYGGMALALLHAAAALKHHFINQDNTLRRMTWG
ncbi:MAG: cytochrome b [Alphaproteobacteria bacterium]|nr:cytochrome b [Alphaproteobacteria bacterium]